MCEFKFYLGKIKILKNFVELKSYFAIISGNTKNNFKTHNISEQSEWVRKKKGTFDSIKCKRYHCCKRLMVFFSFLSQIHTHTHNCHLFSLYTHYYILFCEDDASRGKKRENWRGKMPSITIKTILPFAIPSKIIIFIRRFLFFCSLTHTHTHEFMCCSCRTSTWFRGLLNLFYFISFHIQKIYKMVGNLE